MPPNVLDMHMQDSNMHELFFAFSGPADTPHAGGVCVTLPHLTRSFPPAVDVALPLLPSSRFTPTDGENPFCPLTTRACRYVLKIQLPKTYPFAPPDFLVLTPNGRFVTNTKICMTFSSFHPETWTPSYTLTTLLVSFVSFFAEERSNAIGVMQSTAAQKRAFAQDSVAWCQRHAHGNAKYSDMLPIFKHLKPGLQSDAAVSAAMLKRHPQLAAKQAAPAAAAEGSAVDLSAAPASAPPVVVHASSGPRQAAVKAAGALQPLSPAQQNVARSAHKRAQPDRAVDLAGGQVGAAKAKGAAVVTLDDDDVVVPVKKAKAAALAPSGCVDLT